MALNIEFFKSKQGIATIVGGLMIIGLIVGGIFAMSGQSPAEKARAKYAEQQGKKPEQAKTLNTKESSLTVKGEDVMAVSPLVKTNDKGVKVVPGVIESDPKTEVITSLPVVTSNPVIAPPVPDSLINQNLPGTNRNNQDLTPLTVVETEAKRYLFNNLDPGAIAGQVLLFSDSKALNINKKKFAPQSESIELIIGHHIATNNSELDVVAFVWEPFYFNGNKILDVGDKIIGKAAAGKFRNRVNVSFDKIIFKDGKSTSLSAIAQNTDGTVGIEGVVIGDRLLNSMTPILLEMAGAFADTFKDKLKGTASSISSVGQGNRTSQDDATPKTAGINAGQGALEAISTLLAEDLSENKPYVLVLPGTRCKAVLKSYLDTTERDYGK